jgi:hypothetical protein
MWMVQAEAVERIYHHGCKELAGSPVGQIVGRMNTVKTTRELMTELLTECQSHLQRLGRLSEGE